jgi:transposase-like protein
VGHYERKLLTTSGEVELQVPKLRTLPFETAIIERYQRRESSVEEALIEMFLAGVSCGKFAVVPAWWERSRMGTRRSYWYAPGCGSIGLEVG